MVLKEKRLLSKAETDYHHSTFKVINKGRSELYFRTVTPDNEVKAGDKVVLIEIGKTLWVYKAQSDKL